MKILVTGSTGLVGTALVRLLTEKGDSVTRLTRSSSEDFGDTAYWAPKVGDIESDKLEGHDAVVHLAGENIAGRWTPEKKVEIEKSRTVGTALLAGSLAGLDSPPPVIVSASAVGYYGDRGDEVLTEKSGPGAGFLSWVCVKWEGALKPALEAGIRVVNVRMGIVLSGKGGALKSMLLPFKLGLGGPIGSGEQYWSWITLDDAVGAIYHSVVTEGLRGPVNLVSPNPVTNREFAETLGGVLGRPALIPLPSFAARAVFGAMADELMLASARVLPEKLSQSGYEFRYPDLTGALNHVLS